MKKTIIALSLLLGATLAHPAQAEDQQVLAIIDTAIDSNVETKVIYEVCFTLNSCPNGTIIKDPVTKNSYSFSEGKGSAAVKDWTIKGVDHGYNVTQVALRSNQNLKIVFIRIADEKVYDTFSMIRNDGGSLARALDWVSKNAEKFSIDAVSISQSRSNFAVGTCPNDKLFSDSVVSLNLKNVPTFVATGNDRKTNQVGFPACVDGVIGVGGLAYNKQTASFMMAPVTNVGPGLDVVSSGDDKIRPYLAIIRKDDKWMIDISGTSIATPRAAAILVGQKNTRSLNDVIASYPKVLGYSYISN